MKTEPYIYVDESIHQNLGFIATSFVISKGDLSEKVRSKLASLDLPSDFKELKSRNTMVGNEKLRAVREALFRVAVPDAGVAVLFSSPENRKTLGAECLWTLEKIFRRNGIPISGANIFFDQGIFGSNVQSFELLKTFPNLSGINLNPWCDSKKESGIQVADIIAHACSQIVREDLTGKRKMVNIGGPNTGYDENEEAPLSWTLLMTLRYSFLARRTATKDQYNPEMNQLIVGPEDDAVDLGMHPEMIGWGVFHSEGVATQVVNAINSSMGRIWLGCIH